MNEKQNMIPIYIGIDGRKPRLSKQFAWAIGVQRLSERFQDLSQIGNLQIWFDNHPVDKHWRLTMTQVSLREIAQQVFTVWYCAKGEPNWFFRVFPVESESRIHVINLLEEQAFPEVEKWMKAKRPQTWLQTDKHLRCIWKRQTDSIEIKEECR